MCLSIDSTGSYNYVVVDGVKKYSVLCKKKAGEPAYGVTFIVSVCYG